MLFKIYVTFRVSWEVGYMYAKTFLRLNNQAVITKKKNHQARLTLVIMLNNAWEHCLIHIGYSSRQSDRERAGVTVCLCVRIQVFKQLVFYRDSSNTKCDNLHTIMN